MAYRAQYEPGRATEADAPYDNRTGGPAFAESFWSRLKAELLAGGCLLSVEDARAEVLGHTESYYNRVRKHSSLGYKSAEQVENEYCKNLQV